MAFDPSIISQIGTSGGDVMGAKAKAFQLKDLIDQNTLNQFKLRELKDAEDTRDLQKKYATGIDWMDDKKVSAAAAKASQEGHPDIASEILKTHQSAKTGQLTEQEAAINLHERTLTAANNEVSNVFNIVQASAIATNPDGSMATSPQALDQIANTAWTQARDRLKNDKTMEEGVKQSLLQAHDQITQGGPMTWPKLQQLQQGTKEGFEKFMKIREDQRQARNVESEISHRGVEEKQKEEEIGLRRQALATGNLSPEGQKLKDDLRAKDPTFLSRLSGKGLAEMNKTIEDWAAQGRTADDIVSERIGTKEQAATEVAFDKGPQGNAVRAINVGVQHMGVLRDAIVALKNGNNVAFNAARQKYNQLTGSDIPTNFDAAAEFVGNEVSKAGIGAGASGALADREGVKKNLSRAASGAQLFGQMNVYTGLLAGQMKGLERQYKSGKGKHWEDKVAPETKAALDNLGKSGVRVVTSDQDYEELTPDTDYIAPDGSHRHKPKAK
jgi:hypothetical protein